MIDLAKIEALAANAKMADGSWFSWTEIAHLLESSGMQYLQPDIDARLISACDPDTVLSLIAALRRTRKACRETLDLIEALAGHEVGNMHPNDFAVRGLRDALAEPGIVDGVG